MLIKYKYKTGHDYSATHYGLEPHWHGWYQADLDDFKKFFAEITMKDERGTGEVTEIFLNKQNNDRWHWTQGIGWYHYK